MVFENDEENAERQASNYSLTEHNCVVKASAIVSGRLPTDVPEHSERSYRNKPVNFVIDFNKLIVPSAEYENKKMGYMCAYWAMTEQ